MDFNSIALIFNRALSLTFSKKKNLLVFSVLVLSGLLVVFFRGLALHAGDWVQLSLTFLPIFLCGGILLAMGVFLVRIYHNEIKRKELSNWDILAKSWEVMIGASYFFVPIILSYLLLWMLLGLFVLLKEIPAAGDFFSVILAFAPFLINLGTLVLCIMSLLMLFFITPVIALKGIHREAVLYSVIKKLEKNPFANIILILIALLPLLFLLGLLLLAAYMTGAICLDCQSSLHTIIKWFIIMVPFTAFLTPAVIFFFNFAAESHVLIQKLNTPK